MTTPTSPPPASVPAPAVSARRRARWPFVFFTIFLIGLSIWWAKSAIIRAVVLPIASRVTGAEVRSATATMTAAGVIILRDVQVRAPGLRGPAAEMLTAEEVRIGLDWSSFPPRSPRTIELRRATIRLSQAEDLTLNIAPILRAPATASGGPPPDVRIVDAIIELGEHRGDQFAAMAHLGVSGALTAQDAHRDIYSLVLTQTRASTAQPDQDRTTILGSINRADGSLQIDIVGLDLSDLNPAQGASSFRGYWEQLGIDGRIPDASVRYAPATGLAATFSLENVAMMIPVPASPDPTYANDPAPTDRTDLLAMSDVTGSVRFDASGLRADITGSVEDLRVGVVLVTNGLTLDSPLTCTLQIPEFILTDDPRIKPFAPPLARRIFRRFSGPTATLSGRVQIRRGPDTPAPNRWSYRGAFELRDGTARYEEFPYPVADIDATFHFDDTEFRIVRLSGIGPAGAKVLASGRIWPPGDSAAVEIDVTAADLALDHHMRDAMPEEYRDVFDLLFDAEARAELVAAGLVADPASDAAPSFDLGGTGTMDLQIRRPLGPDQRYSTDITLRLPTASFLPRTFQYPVVATDAVLRITDGLVTIPRMSLAGLSGAHGTLEGAVRYPTGSGRRYLPDLHLSVADVPIDPLLLHAIDQRAPTPVGQAEGSPDPAAIVRALQVQGRVRCDAHIVARADSTYGVDAEVTLDSLAATPGPGVALTDLEGVIRISESRVHAPELRAKMDPATLRIAIDAPLAAGTTESTHLTVHATSLDLGQPIEQAAVSLLPAAQAEEIAGLRVRFRPSGMVDATLDVASAPGSPWTWTIDMHRAHDLAVSLDLGRLTLRESEGGIRIEPESVAFIGFAALSALDGHPLGRVRLDGTLGRDNEAPTDLRAGLTGARFDSAAIHRVVHERSPGLARTMAEYNPQGTFSLALTRTHHPPSPARTEWAVSIDQLALSRDGTTIPIDRVTGPISGTDTAGRIGPMRADGDGWALSVDGSWDTNAGVAFDAAVGLTVSRVTDPFLAGLPAPVDAVLRGLDIRTDGGMTLRDGRLRVASPTPDADPTVSFTGVLDMRDVGLSAGVPINGIDGTATFSYISAPGDPASLVLTLDADRAEISGVSVTRVHADIASDRESEAVLMRALSADVHGGRVLGRGAFRPAGATPSGDGFELHIELQQADFDAMLRDLRPAQLRGAAPVDRGRLDAALSVARHPDPARGLNGRLTARVEGGDVLNLPGVVPLLQVWNLQLPAGERVELAFADGFLDDRGMVFDELGLYSQSLRIFGAGTIRWEDQAIDLSFDSEGVNRIPVLSELFRGLQGEIATARVTGRLSEPRLDYESLSATRRILGAMFGDPDPSPGRR